MAVLRSDTFNRADGSLGTPSDGGSAWVTTGVGVSVASNRAVADVFSSSPSGAAALEASAADAKATVTMVQGWTGGTGPAVRVSDYQNYVGLSCSDATVAGSAPLIVKVEAGVSTTLATCSGTTTAGDVLALEANGTTITAYKNGASIGSATSSFNQSVTKHGFAVGTGNPAREILDDFQIEDVAGGGGAAGMVAARPLRQARNKSLLRR